MRIEKTLDVRSRHLVLFDAVCPEGVVFQGLLLLLSNVLLVASAYVALPLPFSPVPVTGQTFGVLLIAMALGRARATAVVTAYLIEGTLGLPVFAGGSSGVNILVGPTGGYLVGFLLSAFVLGWLAEHGWDRDLGRTVVAMTIGYAIIFASGLAMLSAYVPGSMLLQSGLFPFLPGTAIKIALACLILPVARRFIG